MINRMPTRRRFGHRMGRNRVNERLETVEAVFALRSKEDPTML